MDSLPKNNNLSSKKNNRVVLVGGCFDFIHYGHIHFLTEAKKLGDYLIVALESDENVRRRKGDLRPIHNQKQRTAMLGALSVVDEVKELPTMEKDTDYHQLVSQIHPSVIAVTYGDPYLSHKKHQAAAIGASVVEIPKIQTPSTSQLAKLLDLE